MSNIGIDLGSRSIKIVRLSENNSVELTQIIDSIDFYTNYGKVYDGHFILDLSKLGIMPEDKITATGYGKHNVSIKNIQKISEQKAHMLGAIAQTGLDSFVLLDIGGQDTKILLVKNGKIIDMEMNDKCGAGSGRYLENMANVLQIGLDEMGKYSDNPIDISNTCAIFGESEVLGKVFEGVPLSNIIAGINMSVFQRVCPVIDRFDDSNLVFVGGVAKNKAICSILRFQTNQKIVLPRFPQFNGAIGAAISSPAN